jgi:hypothetical protein
LPNFGVIRDILEPSRWIFVATWLKNGLHFGWISGILKLSHKKSGAK